MCIFCDIIDKNSPAQIVYEDDLSIAFPTLSPVAPVHLLIVPRKHIPSVNELGAEDEALMGHLFSVAKQLASQNGIAQSGFRLIVNTGKDGGQSVNHLYLHLIGGRHIPYMIGSL